MIPTVFADLGFSDDDLTRLSDYLIRASNYFESVSYGKTKLGWEIADRRDWLVLDDLAEPHNRGVATTGFREWIPQTSPRLRLNDFDVVALSGGTVGINSYVSSIGVGAAWLDVSNPAVGPGGRVKFGWIQAGGSGVGWSGIVHEAAHAWLGFQDLYKRGQVPGPFGMWDIMNTTGGKGTELSLWNRFLAGWVDDSQIRCVPRGAEPTIHYISSLTARNSLPKGVVYPLTEGKVLVVESRRPGGFDTAGPLALVYVVDTNTASGDGPFRLIAELANAGDKAEIQGARVELLDLDPYGDLILVTTRP